MNRWDVFVLFLCVVERRCLRRFFNLLQASLHLSKQLLASIVAVVISYLIFPPWNSQNIKLYVSICHITLLFFLLREELTGFVWHRHIWNTINTTYCHNAEPFAHARQCFGRFLSLTALALAVVASSRGSIILVLGAAAVLWWWDMAGKLSDTAHCLCPPARHRLIPRPPALPGRCKVSQHAAAFGETWEHQTWWRNPTVTSATTGTGCHRNINNISLGISNKSYRGVKKLVLSYKAVRTLVILVYDNL